MELTKTDFIHFLNCPKSLWLLKHAPDKYPHGQFSVFLQKLVREGYEVEKFVRQHFERLGANVVFQNTFVTSEGIVARTDAIERRDDGSVVLCEVKSSTRIKADTSHNHLKDACFQLICAERAGEFIDRIVLVHLNGDYVRRGEVDPAALLKFSDVTDSVRAIEDVTAREIDAALALLDAPEIDQNGCPCLHKSRAHHCDTFTFFNPGIPSPSIYSLPRLNAEKRSEFITRGIFDLRSVPSNSGLSESQRAIVAAAKAGKPQVNFSGIKKVLRGLVFPLYFFDFETYASAIPIVDGLRPHQHFPVQYSLHTMEADGSLRHSEFLEHEARLPDRLIARMKNDIGSKGSVVSWHSSFEKTQNREMGKWFPSNADFLDAINDRMMDLEDVFKTDYVDARFDGSTSIKKVLPIVCPNLSYDDLEVTDGSFAMEAWERLVQAEDAYADKIADNLLRYCQRDTFAMVEIYRFLVQFARNL